MDKKNNCNGNDIASSSQEEGENMPTTVKKEQSPKGLSLSTKKLDEIAIKPEVKDGKVLLDKKNKDHRYIMEED